MWQGFRGQSLTPGPATNFFCNSAYSLGLLQPLISHSVARITSTTQREGYCVRTITGTAPHSQHNCHDGTGPHHTQRPVPN